MAIYPRTPNHGGKRVGSGRPRSGKFTRSIFVTDNEHKAVMRFIDGLRGKVKK